MKLFFSKNLVSTLSQHFWDTQYKNKLAFFLLSNKSFNKPYLNNFWISLNFFLDFLDPLEPLLDYSLDIFEKGEILRPFSGLAPFKLNRRGVEFIPPPPGPERVNL